MNTTRLVVSASTFPTQGATALQSNYDYSKLSSLVANRNSRFHLDLSNSTLVQVFEAKESFSRKSNPKYTLSPVITAIKRLEEAIGGTILPVDVTDEFYMEFQDFLLNVPGASGKTVKPSTITTYFSTIQACLNWAAKHRAVVSETYNCWSVAHYEKPKIALTPSMIAHIYYFDLKSETNKQLVKNALKNYPVSRFSFAMLEKARDQFVLECQLGQRYSDAHRFDESNFDDTHTIYHCTQQKTGNKAVVNLSKYSIDRSIAFEILHKYNYKAPASGMDITNCNKLLHLICQAIGGEFEKEFVGENKINGTIVQERFKAWQLITTHTARRTFITYWANNKEMSIVRLQKCTGHKDVRQISRYTIIGDED